MLQVLLFLHLGLYLWTASASTSFSSSFCFSHCLSSLFYFFPFWLKTGDVYKCALLCKKCEADIAYNGECKVLWIAYLQYFWLLWEKTVRRHSEVMWLCANICLFLDAHLAGIGCLAEREHQYLALSCCLSTLVWWASLLFLIRAMDLTAMYGKTPGFMFIWSSAWSFVSVQSEASSQVLFLIHTHTTIWSWSWPCKWVHLNLQWCLNCWNVKILLRWIVLMFIQAVLTVVRIYSSF